MQLSTYSMPDEFAHHGEPILHRFIFDLGAKIAEPFTFERNTDRALQRAFSDPQELFGALFNHADWNRGGCIAHPSILHHTNIQFDDVSVLNSPRAPDPMDNFVV